VSKTESMSFAASPSLMLTSVAVCSWGLEFCRFSFSSSNRFSTNEEAKG
jgi:hypothetical protein